MMANGSGGSGAPTGYSSHHRGNSSTNRNRGGTTSGRKKFGKNLNRVLKATSPAAPPVPSVGSGSQSFFRGSSTSNNGLLLLSTKSKANSGTAATATSISGLQLLGGSPSNTSTTPSTSPKTAHDALLLSAAGVTIASPDQVGGGKGGKKLTSGPVWGQTRRQSSSSFAIVDNHQQLREQQQKQEGDSKKPPPLALSAKTAMKSSIESVTTDQLLSENAQKSLNIHKNDDTKKPLSSFTNNKDFAEQENNYGVVEDYTEPKTPAIPKQVVVETLPQQVQRSDNDGDDADEVTAYMSKLAKQRAEQIQSEEMTRKVQQKQGVTLRLKELDEKKKLLFLLESSSSSSSSKKKQLQSLPQPPPPPPLSKQNNLDARRDASKPSYILEPLGKSKKNAVAASSSPKTPLSPPVEEKNKKLYDPDRPYSSLVGGSGSGSNDKSKKGEKQNSKDYSSNNSNSNKKDEKPILVHLDSLDDHGRRSDVVGDYSSSAAVGPRMLFDPSSGSMVKAKKLKQQQQQLSSSSQKMSDDTAEKLRHIDKSLRREKKVGGTRKDDSSAAASAVAATTSTTQFNKEFRKAQKKIALQRIPRTCGVLFKLDKNGNYVNFDRCEADNGYGAHRVPGGRIRNPIAHSKMLEEDEYFLQEEEHHQQQQQKTESFSFRNDPGFVQHQSDFEAQQQKILEDAWASLVETEDQQPHQRKQQQEHQQNMEPEENDAKPSLLDDEYAAALAMSPSIIGLNFDQNESFDSIMLPPAFKAASNSSMVSGPSIDLQSFSFMNNGTTMSSTNPFSGGMWRNTESGDDLGALSGWDFTSTSEIQHAKTSKSKLNLWGSSVLDSPSKDSSYEPSSNGMG